MNFILSIHLLLWLLISALFFACGEFFSKKFALAPSWSYVALVVFIYALGMLAWLPAILQKNQLSIVGALWSVLSLLATVLIGVLIFGEHVNRVGFIGIFLAMVAIFLLSIAQRTASAYPQCALIKNILTYLSM